MEHKLFKLSINYLNGTTLCKSTSVLNGKCLNALFRAKTNLRYEEAKIRSRKNRIILKLGRHILSTESINFINSPDRNIPIPLQSSRIPWLAKRMIDNTGDKREGLRRI